MVSFTSEVKSAPRGVGKYDEETRAMGRRMLEPRGQAQRVTAEQPSVR